MKKTKKSNKKGFSLIEMLIVIAIIAVLVSIMIPVVKYSTIKARAATNAANLRAIEGEVAMMMNLNPGNFEEYLGDGDRLENIMSGVGGKIVDIFYGENYSVSVQDRYNTLRDNGNQEIEIPKSGEKIRQAVRAKGLEAKRRNGTGKVTVEDDTRMVVYITEQGAMATYNDYNATDFADIAEDGIYDGELRGAGGSGGGAGDGFIGGIVDNIFGEGTMDKAECQRLGKHTRGMYDCLCPYCLQPAHKDAEAREVFSLVALGMVTEFDTSSTRHKCSCGEVFNADHKYANGSHACIYVDCDYEAGSCIDVVSSRNPDHKCDICGIFMEGLCQDGPDRNHSCDVCRKEGITSCSDPAGDGDHKCDECGKTMPDQSCSDTAGDGDHKCDECGKTMSGQSCSDMTGDGDHKCDECGKDEVTGCTYSDGSCTECNADEPSSSC